MVLCGPGGFALGLMRGLDGVYAFMCDYACVCLCVY